MLMKPKKFVENHVSKTKKSSGEYYGTGIKQKVGRMRDSYIDTPITSKKIGKPPKSLA